MYKILFTVLHTLITFIFAIAGIAILFFALVELWHGVTPFASTAVEQRLKWILEAIGLLTIALASFELSQTIYEEEVEREAHLSAPTRVRRFLSRFMVVLTVSLTIELLVAIFRFLHEDASQLWRVASIGFVAAALLIAWGVFIHFNATAERLEPEAMEKVKKEDQKLARAE